MAPGLQGERAPAGQPAGLRMPWSALQASPGNLQQMEEVVFGGGEMVHSSLILAIRLGTGRQGGRLIGVAYADPSAHTLGVAEFTDNDQLSELQVWLGNELSLFLFQTFSPYPSPVWFSWAPERVCSPPQTLMRRLAELDRCCLVAMSSSQTGRRVLSSHFYFPSFPLLSSLLFPHSPLFVASPQLSFLPRT